MTIRTTHQHEKWQIRESASGGFYCAACGEHTNEDGSPLSIEQIAEDFRRHFEPLMQFSEKLAERAAQVRQIRAEAWDEAAAAYSTWSQKLLATETQPLPDKPENPYRRTT